MASNQTKLVNIGPKETRKRLLMGIVMVVVGVVLAVILSHAGVSRGVVFLAISAVLDGDSRFVPGSQEDLSGSRRARRAQHERHRRTARR